MKFRAIKFSVLLGLASAAGVSADETAVTGWLYDNLCIDNCEGTSGPTSCTPDGSNAFYTPSVHTGECLLFDFCIKSGHSIMSEFPGEDGRHSVILKLLDDANTTAYELVKNSGISTAFPMVETVFDDGQVVSTDENGVPSVSSVISMTYEKDPWLEEPEKYFSGAPTTQAVCSKPSDGSIDGNNMCFRSDVVVSEKDDMLVIESNGCPDHVSMTGGSNGTIDEGDNEFPCDVFPFADECSSEKPSGCCGGCCGGKCGGCSCGGCCGGKCCGTCSSASCGEACYAGGCSAKTCCGTCSSTCGAGCYAGGCSAKTCCGTCSAESCGAGCYAGGCSAKICGTCSSTCGASCYAGGCSAKTCGTCSAESCGASCYAGGCSAKTCGTCSSTCGTGCYAGGCSAKTCGTCSSTCGAGCNAGGCSAKSCGTCSAESCGASCYAGGCSAKTCGTCSSTCGVGCYAGSCSAKTCGTCSASSNTTRSLEECSAKECGSECSAQVCSSCSAKSCSASCNACGLGCSAKACSACSSKTCGACGACGAGCGQCGGCSKCGGCGGCGGKCSDSAPVGKFTPFFQHYTMKIPSAPGAPGEKQMLKNDVVGLMFNGVVIDSHKQTWAYDVCNGHSDENHQYHYHIPQACYLKSMGIAFAEDPNWWINDAGDEVRKFDEMAAQFPAAGPASPVIGVALDGFPIYGLYDDQGDLQRSKAYGGSLDECNGKLDSDNNYGYYLSADPPFAPACLKGEKVGTFEYATSKKACPKEGIQNTIQLPSVASLESEDPSNALIIAPYLRAFASLVAFMTALFL